MRSGGGSTTENKCIMNKGSNLFESEIRYEGVSDIPESRRMDQTMKIIAQLSIIEKN